MHTRTRGRPYCSYPHFTDAKTESGKSDVTWAKLHRNPDTQDAGTVRGCLGLPAGKRVPHEAASAEQRKGFSEVQGALMEERP